MIKHDTWALVADGEKALFLRNEGDPEHVNLQTQRVETQELHENSEIYSDKPGRMYDGGPDQRSSMEPVDWKQIERARFADEMAGILERMVRRKDFERIIIAAPPQVLGELRPKLHKTVEACIVAEVNKDFTNMPLDKMEQKLVQHLEAEEDGTF